MQRQQSQAQLETLTNLGAVQVAKTTYDSRDFQTKRFPRRKVSMVTRKLGRIGGTSFVSRLRGVSVKRLRSWIGLRTDTISRYLSLTSGLGWHVKFQPAVPWWSGFSHGRVHWRFRTPRLKWSSLHGDDCITSMILATHWETYSCWRGCARRRKLAIQTWLQAWRDSSKSCEWFARELAMMCRTSGNRYTWCASTEDLSEDLPWSPCCAGFVHWLFWEAETDDRKVSSSKRAWVRIDAHGCPRPCQDQGRQERRQGKRQGMQVKEVRRQLFLVWRVWPHDAWWKTAKRRHLGNRKFPSSREEPIRSRRVKAKVAMARRERCPLTSGQTVRNFLRLMRKLPRRQQVPSLVPSVDTRGTVNETGKPGKESRNRREISGSPTSGNFWCQCCRLWAGRENRLTWLCCLRFAGGCCVHSWDARVEQNSPWVQCCNRCENSKAWVQDSDTQISDWWRAEFDVQCYGQVAQTSGGSVQGCCSWQSDCATARESRWFHHRRHAFKAQETDLWTKWGQTKFTETVGAPGQVVPRRLAGLSLSPISRSHVEKYDEKCGPWRTNIISWPCIFGLHSKKECQTSKDIVANYRDMFESRISAAADEIPPTRASGKPDAETISSWSYDMEGHAK